MELTAFSDRGIGTRERLEDYAADRVVTTAGGLQLQIAMVCDGAGGGEAGELAARLTSRTIFEYLEVNSETSVPKLLIKAVEEANKAVYAELQGTGTSTVALAAVHLNEDGSPYGRLFIANVGNSRIYLIREGRLVRLNIDHTLANEYVFAGQMSPEEAKELNDPNYVTRSIGTGAKVSVDIGFYAERGREFVNSRRAARIGQKGLELQEGDTIFAASDGLFPFVQDNEFVEYALDDDVERATRTLLKYAADRRPDDNTALSMLFVPSRNRKTVVVAAPRLSTRQRAGIGFFILAIALALIFMALQVSNSNQQQVALLATQQSIQGTATVNAYTSTPTSTATPISTAVKGQVGNRYYLSAGDKEIPIFSDRFIDPLLPPEINYLLIFGVDVLADNRSKEVNPAHLYLQPSSSINLANVIDAARQQHIDLGLSRGADLFVNLGDYSNGGVSLALIQNTDIVFQSLSSCFSARQIPADPANSEDTEKVALTCYGGDNTCSYQLPGQSTQLMLGNKRYLLDITNNQLNGDPGSISQDEVDTYRQTIWDLTHNIQQLNCLQPWLDEDGDGILYPTDQCPVDPGSAAAKGCPDQDNDGIQDSVDQCPNEYGAAANQGCPIPNNDGDSLGGTGTPDFCPFEKGPVETGGCPDATEYYNYLTQTGVASTPDINFQAVTPTASVTPIPLPEARSDHYSTALDKPLTIPPPGLLINDKVNLATLQPFTGATTQGGSVNLNADGSFTYTPLAGYIGSDTFDYTLTGTLGDSSATVTIDVLKPPIAAPVAAFTANPEEGPAPLDVVFTDASTGVINTWDWDFGDGSTSKLPNPLPHQYLDPGVYTVTLIVTGPGGTSTATGTVTVKLPVPIACISPNPASVVQYGRITFTSCSGVVSSYEWSVVGLTTPPGDTDTYTVVAGATNFQVCLIVTNSEDTPSKPTCITVTVTLPPLSCTVANAGDITGSGSATFTAVCKNIIGTSVDADYQWSLVSPPAGYTLTQTTGASITNTFSNTGATDVTLTVALTFKNAGRTANATAQVVVKPNPVRIVACISLNGNNYDIDDTTTIPIFINKEYTFGSGCSTIPDEPGTTNPPTVTYKWTIVDSSNGIRVPTGAIPGTGASQKYTFPDKDTFTVSLTITPQAGSTVLPGSVTIKVPTIVDVCFTASQTTVNVGDDVVFDASCSVPTGVDADYKWDFGDGVTNVTGKRVTHTFAVLPTGTDPSKYVVKLTYLTGSVTKDIILSTPAAACYNVIPALASYAANQFIYLDGACSTGVTAGYAWTSNNAMATFAAAAAKQTRVTFANGTGLNTTVRICLDINGNTADPSAERSCKDFLVLAAPTACPIAVPDGTYDVTHLGAQVTIAPPPNILANDTVVTGSLIAFTVPAGEGTVNYVAGTLLYTPPDATYTNPNLTVTYNLDLVAGCGAGSDGTFTLNVAPLTAKIDVSTPLNADGTTYPRIVDFQATTTGKVDFYNWDFGDGQTDFTNNSATPNHTYAADGAYTVTLTVTSNNVGSVTVVRQIIIKAPPPPPPAPVPPAAAISASIVDSTTVSFASASTGNINIYNWDFGDGSPRASTAGMVHTFPSVGVYTVTLIVVGPTGADVTTATIDLNATPTPTHTRAPRTATPTATATLEPSQQPPDTGTTPQPTPRPTRKPTLPPPPTLTPTPLPTETPYPAPIAVDDAFSVSINGSITLNVADVLANDTLNGASASIISGTTHGTIVQNPDDPNVYTYTPEADFTGTDTATYSLTNPGGSSTAAVTFTVN